MVIDSPPRTPHISYYDQTNGELMYNRGYSANPESVDYDDDVGQYTSIAVDSGDRPRIVYYDKNPTAS